MNRVYSMVKGMTCAEVCNSSKEKHCDGEISLNGGLSRSTTQEPVGIFYNYGCHRRWPMHWNFESVARNESLVKKKPTSYFSYCCCRP